jgi:hypothetical protein
MALAVWSSVGTGLFLGTQMLMQRQRSDWLQTQAVEWEADLFERLHLAHMQQPLRLDWGQTPPPGGDCQTSDCDATQWRDHLLADWFARWSRDMPQAQVWLAPWPSDGRLQMVVLRWPDNTAMQQVLLPDQPCPTGWHCLMALGWP